MSPEIHNYLNSLKNWQEELTKLREIILDCELKEEFKWKHPCYTNNKKNIVLIHEFKEYCAMLFTKGALLKDPGGILVQQTENTQSARQIRFTKTSEITAQKHLIKEYIKEAIENELLGLKVEKKKTIDVEIPLELKQKFAENTTFEKAFKNLTKGRQNGYLLFFNKAKQSKTKIARIEKNIQRIIDGYGLNDCDCGLSKRKPNCDGSHKQLKSM